MRFRESIFAEATNLIEDMLGKIAGQTVLTHAFEQFDAESVNHTGASPGGHRTTQLVGLHPA